MTGRKYLKSKMRCILGEEAFNPLERNARGKRSAISKARMKRYSRKFRRDRTFLKDEE